MMAARRRGLGLCWSALGADQPEVDQSDEKDITNCRMYQNISATEAKS